MRDEIGESFHRNVASGSDTLPRIHSESEMLDVCVCAWIGADQPSEDLHLKWRVVSAFDAGVTARRAVTGVTRAS